MVRLIGAVSKIVVGKNTKTFNLPSNFARMVCKADALGAEIVAKSGFKNVSTAERTQALKAACLADVRAQQFEKFDKIMQQIRQNKGKGITIDYGVIYDPYKKCAVDSMSFYY